MPDPEQLPLDLEALPGEHLPGGMPADPAALKGAMQAWYRQMLDKHTTPLTCQPERGVHIYADHAGTDPCLCKSRPPTPKGAS